MMQPGTPPSSSSPVSATDAELAEDQFFDALATSDVERVDQLLAQDFLIVDVISGRVVDRAAFIAALRDRLLAFERVDLVERRTRHYGETAVIVGRTEMAGSLDAARFAVASRYTHVLVRERDGRWRLVSGQGTRIVDA
jgi:ketosteroid isomerase-like protein